MKLFKNKAQIKISNLILSNLQSEIDYKNNEIRPEYKNYTKNYSDDKTEKLKELSKKYEDFKKEMEEALKDFDESIKPVKKDVSKWRSIINTVYAGSNTPYSMGTTSMFNSLSGCNKFENRLSSYIDRCKNEEFEFYTLPKNVNEYLAVELIDAKGETAMDVVNKLTYEYKTKFGQR